MANIQLRQILNKRKQTARQVEQLTRELDIEVHIQDVRGEWIWGNPQPEDAIRQSIEAAGETLGWIYGNGHTELISSLIAHLAEKE